MSVLSFERFTTAPGARDGFAARAELHLDEMRRAPGALWADLAEVAEGYLVLSEWRSDADLAAWTDGGPARSFVRDVDALLVGEATRRLFGSPH